MDDLGGLRDLRRLKIIGVGAPVVLLVVFEAFRLGILEAAFRPPTSNILAAVIGVAGALVFGLLIFFHIERAQRHIVVQNRDLAIVNAVSVAIQGELDVEAVLRAALDEIARSTGASEATVTVQPGESDADSAREIAVASPAAAGDALAGPEQVVDLPLSAGSGPVGRLRLRIPATRIADLPSPSALHTVGHQLGAALQIGELVADLNRRKNEGHTFYQSLVAISNQAPLPGILELIVEGARERLAADEGRICLTQPVLHTFQGEHDLSGDLADGIVCDVDADATGGETRRHACPIGAPTGYAATLLVPIWTPGELLGDLWLARRTGRDFSERDRRYLATLAGIAAIAITAARLREHERQGAILAERDRIARELHDSLAQVLGSTHLRLRTILARTDLADQPRVAAELDDLAGVAEEAYRDVREAILGLREASHTQGLIEALQKYLDKYSQQSGIAVVLDTPAGDEPALSTNSEIQVIRVIQEALTNVRKHARATTANVRITDAGSAGGITIVIEDDGRGFEPGDTRVHRDGGYGLQTMRERMELAGGSLRIDSAPGRGTRVIAIIPQIGRGPADVIPADGIFGGPPLMAAMDRDAEIRVLLVDDQPLFRRAIATLIADQPHLTIAGEAENGVEAVEMAHALAPDLVLMDVEMPVMNGVEATRRIRDELPGVKVVILTVSESDEHLFDAIRYGAHGYLLKNLRPEQLYELIRAVMRDETALSPAIAGRLLREFRERPVGERVVTPEADGPGLTHREIQIMQLVAEGLSNKEIGNTLSITEGTVKNHVHNALEKLQLENRIQAAAYVVRHGLGMRVRTDR